MVPKYHPFLEKTLKNLKVFKKSKEAGFFTQSSQKKVIFVSTHLLTVLTQSDIT
jgi:hypothetical protein